MVANKRRSPNIPQKGMNDAKNIAHQAQANEWVERMMRIGYATRGVIYGLIGYLAVQTIFTGRGRITDQKGVLSTIAAQPYGKFVLILMVIGLVGLVIWGFIRAVADPFHKGSDAKGMLSRVGYMISGISYGVLLVPTVNLIRGSSGNGTSGSSQQAQQAAAGIMAHSWGPWLVGLVGLILLIVGLVRIYEGAESKLHERFKAYAMNAEQRRWAIRLGRIGYVALGIVFAIIGLLAIIAARTVDPKKVAGLDGALLFLARQSYGPWLLAIVALGLIAYAIYSFLGAMWFRFKGS
jgi:hypothetical protein